MNKKMVIDLGNTLAKAAIFQEGKMHELQQFEATDPALIKWITAHEPLQSGIIGSVREIPDQLLELFNNKAGFLVLNHETPLPFRLAYNSPKSLGPDRIALAAAAFSRFPGKNVLVVDMGTCITYDFLRADGVYIGGAISPGIFMRFKAMNQFTSKLPLAAPIDSAPLIASDTISCLQSGVMHGVQAEIAGIIREYESIYEELTVLIGGGDNKYFDKRFKVNIFADANLVIEGLNVIVDFNEIQ
ncbi:MAG: type III pantothenate kinase [Bacteroidetes bacterium]|jgi:type III pantothenate kinase|nr:type III pantothenate kinase [Bacteroidota bacterium]